MFTLHFADNREPVMHDAPRNDEPFKCNHATTARKRALHEAKSRSRQVTVSRADRPAYTVSPQGHILPPSGMDVNAREFCKATVEDAPCFCTACRADRREQRKA